MKKLLLFKKIWEIIPNLYRYKTVIIGLLILVGTLFEMLSVGIIIPAIIFIINPTFSDNYKIIKYIENISYFEGVNIAIIGIILLLIIYIIKTIYLALLSNLQAKYIFDIKIEISQIIFENYMNESYEYHISKNSAQLIRNMTTETSEFVNRLLIPAMIFITELCIASGILILIFIVNPKATLIITLIFGLALWVFQKLTNSRIQEWGKVRQYNEGKRIQKAQEGLSGAKELMLLNRTDNILNEYQKYNRSGGEAEYKLLVLQQLPRLWLELVAVICLSVVIIEMKLSNENVTELIATIALFAAAAFRIMPSASRMINAYQAMNFSKTVISLFSEELSLNKTKVISGTIDSDFKNEIEYKNVSYYYPGSSEAILKNINLKIKKGEIIGVVGASGSGKSTFINVLSGILPATYGTVSIDGININDCLRSWQNHIGYVQQDLYLTDDTITANIAFGLNKDLISMSNIDSAIKAAGLTDFISSLPDKLNTVVGDRGVRLSGGQKQRIAIARAFYHNPQVIIFDEATSALDSEAENIIMGSIEKFKGVKTMIIVAHRKSTLKDCNKIYSFSNDGIETVTMETYL